jgi:nitroreductase
MDWASQPDPFRRYPGAQLVELTRGLAPGARAFAELYEGDMRPVPVDGQSVGVFLRHSMGLSAWKVTGRARWPLRVNPSSGNLHPTEAYIVHAGRVSHYAPREHALEERAHLGVAVWDHFSAGRTGFLVALTSIHWREAWKYGERAFRYCQHDVGHAIGALRMAAAWHGWHLVPLPVWSDAQLDAVIGTDRAADRPGAAEREEPEYVAVVTPEDPAAWLTADPEGLVAAARGAAWHGVANQLSPNHADWAAIDRVSETTRYPGLAHVPSDASVTVGSASAARCAPSPPVLPGDAPSGVRADHVILGRRSAVAFDARSSLPLHRFLSMLARLQPGAPPWDAIEWPPQVHLAVFVHRVEGLTPGAYAYLRDDTTQPAWRSAMRSEFLWERVPDDPTGRLFLLLPIGVTDAARRVSCDQDIAADGFFSLGMIARCTASLRDRGEWFYRRLFWECGLIGQVLYLEAEAAGARGTGIGCFYDDAVHELLGLSGHDWQSLYHFSMGVAVEDARLTTEPGYAWESTPRDRS